MSVQGSRYKHRSWRSRVSRVKVLYLSLFLCVACRHAAPSLNNDTTCNPEMEAQNLLLHLHAGKSVNHDRHGESLPTRLTVFQLAGSTIADLESSNRIRPVEDMIVAQHELTIYPGQSIELQLERAVDATHVAVSAELREPLGLSWVDEVRLPSREFCEAQVEGDVQLTGARVTMDLNLQTDRQASHAS